LSAVIGALAFAVLTFGSAAAQVALPDIDVTFVVEVRDVARWGAFHAEVLATSDQASKHLEIAIADTGETRGLTVARPKFNVSFVKGVPSLKVVVVGKVTPGEALGSLGAFEAAVFANDARPGQSVVGLYYGLASVGADLIEMHVSRP